MVQVDRDNELGALRNQEDNGEGGTGARRTPGEGTLLEGGEDVPSRSDYWNWLKYRHGILNTGEVIRGLRREEDNAKQGGNDPGADNTPVVRGKQKKNGSKKKSKKNRKKWLIFGGVSGSIIGLGVGIFLFLLASSFLIPNLTQNIMELEFSRLSRQFAYSMTKTVSQVLAVQSTSDAALKGEPKSLREFIKDRYASENPLFNKLSKLGLDKVSNNLQIADEMKFNYTTTRFGNKVIQSIKMPDGRIIDVPVRKGVLRNFIPEFADIPHLWDKVGFAFDFVPALEKALGASGNGAWGTLLRGSPIAAIVRSEFKIGLGAWTAGRLLSFLTDTSKVRFTVEEVSFDATTRGGTDPAKEALTDDVRSASEELNQEVDQIVHSDKPQDQAELLDSLKKGNNVPQKAIDDAGKTIEGSGFIKNFLKVGDPLLTASMTACIIFEGSLEQAGPTIDTTLQHQMRTFFLLAGIASEQEAGGPVIPAPAGKENPASAGLRIGLGAMRDKLADVTKSNAYIMANGGTVDTTATSVSAEAGGMQSLTLLDVLFHSSDGAKAASGIAEAVCPVMTHPVTAVVLTGLNIGLFIASLGGEGAAEETIAQGATRATESVVGKFLGNVGEKLAAQGLAGTLKRVGIFMGKQVGFVGGTIGATEIAKLIVYANSGMMYNGLEQGADYINSAQAGANGYSNEQLRQQTFARATTYAETAKNDALDKQYVMANNASRSFVDRYLAISNPDSLLARAATMTYGGVYQLKADPGSAIAGLLMAPLHLAGTLASAFSGQAFADVSPGTQHYGNVQFGWSAEEQALIDSSDSYLPLENERILNDSGMRDRIAEKYSDCFGYGYDASGTSWDPADEHSKLISNLAGEGSIGTLLSSGEIRRTANGDLDTHEQYLCSPENLGPHNPEFGDLVFRFRISESYYTTLAQLHNLETVTVDQ